MKIDKVIFCSDESHFLNFWPIQAKVWKNIMNVDPVLFIICDEESEFYHDGLGTVKKIQKIPNINTGAQAAMGRMYFTKYFPEEVLFISDIDLLTFSKEYLNNNIKDVDENFFVILESDQYDESRQEVFDYINRPLFFKTQLYNYHANIGKGKIFNQIIDTDRTFQDYIYDHFKFNGELFWGVDELYFSKKISETNIDVVKLKRDCYSPWKTPHRINRHHFPVNLFYNNEIEAQQRDGVYDIEKLKRKFYYDADFPRPYKNYKDEIDKFVNLIFDTYSKKKSIIGSGGHARELRSQIDEEIVFFVDDEFLTDHTKPLSEFDPNEYITMIAVGDSKKREQIKNKLPENTQFFTFIHPTALIMDSNIEIGQGTFIGAYSVLTTNIKLGEHCLINRGVQIGHDCVIGDYFSAMPNSVVSGNVKIGDKVYLGTNSSVKEKINICDNVTIGLNSGVVKDINEEGVYVGIPAKKIK